MWIKSGCGWTFEDESTETCMKVFPSIGYDPEWEESWWWMICHHADEILVWADDGFFECGFESTPDLAKESAEKALFKRISSHEAMRIRRSLNAKG